VFLQPERVVAEPYHPGRSKATAKGFPWTRIATGKTITLLTAAGESPPLCLINRSKSVDKVKRQQTDTGVKLLLTRFLINNVRHYQ
jgi:hypothetical protein